jgi:hypothetical protein
MSERGGGVTLAAAAPTPLASALIVLRRSQGDAADASPTRCVGGALTPSDGAEMDDAVSLTRVLLRSPPPPSLRSGAGDVDVTRKELRRSTSLQCTHMSAR